MNYLYTNKSSVPGNVTIDIASTKVDNKSRFELRTEIP